MAVDEASPVMSAGCHSSEMPSEWEHDEPCSPTSVVPCHLCAIIITLPVLLLDEMHAVKPDPHAQSLVDVLQPADPDPPKTSLL